MSHPEAGGAALSRTSWVAFVLLLLLGTCLRLCFLDEGALFIDEGESTLNALSILEHGYPAASYLGLPMFENTLTEAWPESEEYEFRDSSYSREGVAVYHGWLPLYAIAASLACHGIHPDQATELPRVKYSDEEIHARIRAARLPAVWFGALFLVAIFLAGRVMHGVDAGLCAMLLAALAPKCIWLAQQARYYSAALAFGTLAVYCAWMVHRRGRWRDFVLAGVVFVLLFHTGFLAFLLSVLACVPLLPGIWARDRAALKLACWAAIVTLGLLPWLVWTGFLEHTESLPMARSLLAFPSDYFVYLRERPGRLVAGVCLIAAFAALLLARSRLPARVARPLGDATRPVFFCAGWIVVAYFGFQVLVPAASCSMARLSHFVIAGPLLLIAIGLAAGSRILWPSRSALLSCGAALGLMVATGKAFRWQHHSPYDAQAVFELVDHLRGRELARDTKLYALPYQHFCLTYYTGLPIQSIAPVRREFLDRYPGEVLILETTNRLPQPTWESVRDHAREAGHALGDAEARDWVPVLHELMIRAEVEPLVREVEPPADSMPDWAATIVADLRREAASTGHGHNDYSADNPAMFHGYPPMTLAEFWPAFFYRFVQPEERVGAKLNYAGRMHEATAWLLPSTWIVLCCPARPPIRESAR